MSNWPLAGAARYEVIGVSGSQGVLVITGGAADTKGAWVAIGTVPFPASGFWLFVTSAVSVRYRLDLAVDAGGGNQVILPDLYLDMAGQGTRHVAMFFPLALPAGATVRCRTQAPGANVQARISVGMAGGDFLAAPPMGSRCVTLATFVGGASGTDPAAVTETGLTPTGWTELTAAAPARLSGLYITAGHNGDISRTSCNLVIEIATGSLGQEVVRVVWPLMQAGNAVQQAILGPIPCDIAEGTPVLWRVTCSAAAVDTIGVAALGFVA